MKWIVAPTEAQKGTGGLDFSWTNPGEILTVGGFKCSRGYPEDGCGCCRAFSGLKSRKATTVAVIAEIPISIEKVARQDVMRFWCDTVEAKELAEYIGKKIDDYRSIIEEIDKFEVGTRIGVEFKRIEDFHDMTLFVAGSRQLYGI